MRDGKCIGGALAFCLFDFITCISLAVIAGLEKKRLLLSHELCRDQQ